MNDRMFGPENSSSDQSSIPMAQAPQSPSADYEAWLRSAAKSAPNGDVAALNWQTPDGISVKPLYTADDTKALPHANTLQIGRAHV